MNSGLVLIGGGARGAYQVGVLKGISDLMGTQAPIFKIISGVSVGAVNGAFLAARADNPRKAIDDLADFWNQIEVKQILDVDALSFSQILISWLRNMLMGGAPRGRHMDHMLGTLPLKRLLHKKIDFEALARHIKRGTLRGFAVTTTDYETGSEIVFFDAHSKVRTWERSSRAGVRARIDLPHVMASASLPLLFAPVRIAGRFYGDGSIRQYSPLSPAAHLGADRVLAISLRNPPPPEPKEVPHHAPRSLEKVSFAEVIGVLLNATFYNGLDFDFDRVTRINQVVDVLQELPRLPQDLKLRKMPTLVLRPSVDLSAVASNHLDCMPPVFRHFLKVFGVSEQEGTDLLSYLAFDHRYARRLMQIGRQDAEMHLEKIRSFFEDSPMVAARRTSQIVNKTPARSRRAHRGPPRPTPTH